MRTCSVALVLALLALAVVSVALPSAGVSSQRGSLYFGGTSQGEVAAARASPDGGVIRWLDLDVRARCRNGRTEEQTVTIKRVPVGPRGRFAVSGRLERFDSGPGEGAGNFPVVVRGRVAGRFPSARRLVGTARLVLGGRFYDGGGSEEGFFSHRTTCRSGPISFSAETTRETRSRVGQLAELQGAAGCVHSSKRKGCRHVPAVGAPQGIWLSPDGRYVYVLSPGGRGGLVVFASDRQSGALRKLDGKAGCVRADRVQGCATVRGLRDAVDAAISPDGRHLYLIGSEPPAVAVFNRNRRTGGLSQLPGSAGCLGGQEHGCGRPPAVDDLLGIEISPDGRHLYVAWSGYQEPIPEDDGVLWLRRDRTSGAIGAPGVPNCISDRGLQGCTLGPAGLTYDFVLSPDGRHLYAALYRGPLAAFRRDPRTGALEPLAEPDTCHLAARPRGCQSVPVEGNPEALAISPDGRSVYYGSDAGFVAVLARRLATGGLTQLPPPWACVGDDFAAGCRLIRGVEFIDVLAVTGDGGNVYVGSAGDGLLAVLARRPDGNLLQLRGQAGCLLGREGDPLPLYGPWGCRRTGLDYEISALAPSPDGRHLYVASADAWGDSGGVHVLTRRRAR